MKYSEAQRFSPYPDVIGVFEDNQAHPENMNL